MRLLEVLAAGPGATVQDLGRPGFAELGVGGSGAVDPPSLRLANRLLGNPETHAGLEITFGGLRIRLDHPALVAVTGAEVPVTVSGPGPGIRRSHWSNTPIDLHAGQELAIGPPRSGVRSYLTVRGGVDVPPVLGSRATDTLSGLGPAPLRAGMTLPVGETALDYPGVDLAPRPALPVNPVLRVLPGPRDDWFTGDGTRRLCDGRGYRVGGHSDRVGMRLHGPKLDYRAPGELAPEATVPGALQVPPSGQPILFLADHPVTGGYPVIGVVHPADLPLAAQTPPGARLRFRLTPYR